MFTSGETWLFQGLAGIQPHPAALAWSTVLFKPRPPPASAGLSWVNASLTTVRGVITSAWTLAPSGKVTSRISNPPSSEAAPLSEFPHPFNRHANATRKIALPFIR